MRVKIVLIIAFMTLVVIALISQECIATQSYGFDSNYDRLCDQSYQGEYGKLRIPLAFHYSTNNNLVNLNQIDALIASVNEQFDVSDLPVEFYSKSLSSHSDIGVQYCSFDPSGGSCDCTVFGGSSYFDVLSINNDNLDAINVFLFEDIYLENETSNSPCENGDNYTQPEGNAFYPNTVAPPDGANNYLLIRNEIVNDEVAFIFAHELGHIFGLHHTFETGVFDDHPSDRYDGIQDTGDSANFGYDDSESTSLTCNLMDYSDVGINQSDESCPLTGVLTDCQKSKFLDVLFECRPNLSTSPDQPDIQLASGLSVNYLNYENVSEFDLLISNLDELTGTNTSNYASFRLLKNGEVIQSWYIDTLDLNQVFTDENDRNGTYLIEVVDSLIYNNIESSATSIEVYFNDIQDTPSDGQSTGNCFEIVYADYTYECGGNFLSLTSGAQFFFNGRDCGTNDPNAGNGNSGGGGGSGGGFGGSGGGGPGKPGGTGTSTVNTDSNVPVVNENDECQECVKELQRKVQLLNQSLNQGN